MAHGAVHVQARLPWLAPSSKALNAVVWSVACLGILSQLLSVHNSKVWCVVLAVAWSFCAAWSRCMPAGGVHSLSTDPKTAPPPCLEVNHVINERECESVGMSKEDGCSGPYKLNLVNEIAPTSPGLEQSASMCDFFDGALCCILPRHREAEGEAEPTTQSNEDAPRCPIRACKEHSVALSGAAKELRARIDDLLGPSLQPPTSPETRKADMVAVTAVERYGGEFSCIQRFLRASKFNVAAAEERMRRTVEFRRRTGANHIVSDPLARKVWNSVRPLFTAAPLTFSAGGNAVIYFKMAEFLHIWRRGVSEEHLQTFYISWMEHCLELQAQGRARMGRGRESEMPACIEVYDLSGLGLSHLRCVSGLKMLMRILRIGQDHYPENLHTAVMINVPPLACRGLQMVQTVLDARTRAKLRFCYDDGQCLLKEVLGQDPEGLVRSFHDVAASGFLKGLI